MTYRTGTVSSSNVPAYFLVKSIIEPDMLNVGWVKVSTNVSANAGNAGNNLLWNVYKSPGTNNSIGQDFFVYLGWDNASNANLVASISEQWNSSANTMLGYGPMFTVSSIASPSTNNWANANPTAICGSPGIGTAANASWIATQVGSGGAMQNSALSLFSFNYQQSITIDRIIVQVANTVNLNCGPSFYAGVYESFMNSIMDPIPITLVNLNYSAASSPGTATQNTISSIFVREPNLFTSCTSSWSGTTIPLNAFPPGSNVLEVYSNRAVVIRCMMLGRQTTAFRGLLKDVYTCSINSTRGDQIQTTINGTLYTLTGCGPTGGPSSQSYYFLQV